MWPADDREEQEPDWVTSERQEFSEHLDKNGDGFMDREELAPWILPEYELADLEAKLLLCEADSVPDKVAMHLR